MSHLSDPLGDLLTRMRNAQRARRASCCAPWSRVKQELLELLKSEGWVQDVAVLGEGVRRELEVTFVPGKALSLRRVSSPGQRIYKGAGALMPILRGFGIAVLTTSQGLLTDKEARKRKVGGEILCTVS